MALNSIHSDSNSYQQSKLSNLFRCWLIFIDISLSIKIMRFFFLFSDHTARFGCSQARRLLFVWRFSLVWCWGWRLLPFYLACFGKEGLISRFLSRLWSWGCRWMRTRRSSSCSSSGQLVWGGVSPYLRKWVWNLQFSSDVRNRCIRRSLASCLGLPPWGKW